MLLTISLTIYPLSIFIPWRTRSRSPRKSKRSQSPSPQHKSWRSSSRSPHRSSKTKKSKKSKHWTLTLWTPLPPQSSANTAWWSLWMDCFCHAHQHVSVPQFFDYRLAADFPLFICFRNGPQCGCCDHNPGLGWVFLRWSVNLYRSFCFVNCFICFPLVLNRVFKKCCKINPPPPNFTIKTIIEGNLCLVNIM